MSDINDLKNDFFNLNSDDDDDTDKETSKKVSKWDWDKEENKHLYYEKRNHDQRSINAKQEPKQTASNYQDSFKLKRPLLSHDYGDDSDESKSKCLKIASNCLEYDEDQETSRSSGSSGQQFWKLKVNLTGHKDTVNRIYWCNKIENRNHLLSSSMDGSIIIWDISNKSNIVKKLNKSHKKSVRNAIWSKYCTEIASISYDQSCVVWDVHTGEEINKLTCDYLPTAICACPTNDNCYLVGGKNSIYSWDYRTNKIVKTYTSRMGQVQDILFINDNEFITSGDTIHRESAEYSLMVWDYETRGILSNQIFFEKYVCTCLKKHPNYSLFYAQTHGSYIAEFSTRSPFKMNKLKRFEGHLADGYNIGFDINSTGTLLISGSSDGKAIVYNCQTSKLMYKINAFTKPLTQPCTDAKFHPHSNNLLALSSWNGIISVYKNE